MSMRARFRFFRATVSLPVRLLLTLGLTSFAVACHSDPPTTTVEPPDGEQPNLVSGIPVGWFGGSTAPSQFDLGVDSGIRHSGRACAYIRTRGGALATEEFAALSQALRGDQLRGKRVRLSAYVRPTGIGGRGANLYLRLDGPREVAGFGNMGGQPLMGTSGWTLASIVMDVPNDVLGVQFGVVLSGPGELRIDDISVEVVSTDVPVTDVTHSVDEPYDDPEAVAELYDRRFFLPQNLDFEGVIRAETSAATVAWLQDNAIAFTSDDPATDDADLAPLGAAVGGARVVALGEATHGTREFFRMKHRVFEYLVRHLGFTHFAIEASFPEALAVDRYVQTGQGDPAALVDGLYFWTWNTEEVVDLVRWMRAYNAAGPATAVHFVGFDMQHPGWAIDSAAAFVRRVDPVLAGEVDDGYACLDEFRNQGTSGGVRIAEYASQPQSFRTACRQSVAAVAALFAAHTSDWSAATSSRELAMAAQYARLVVQWEEMAALGLVASGRARDRSMAENVGWWLSQLPADGRMMLWAHNVHVSRARGVMGGYLGRDLGAGYLNAGFSFGGGEFNAVEQFSNGVFGALRSFSVATREPSSVEALFAADGRPRLILDARRIASGGAATEPLLAPLTVRTVGAAFNRFLPPQSYQTPLVLPGDYDLLIWFATTTASRLNPFALSALSATAWSDEPLPSR